MSLLSHRAHDDRPWGSFDQFTLNEASTVKLLTVLAGKRLSLQKHAHRSEFWRVVSGSGTATVGTEERVLKAGDEVEIPQGTLHRLAGSESESITVLEIALGNFDENDIERIEDDFGRAA